MKLILSSFAFAYSPYESSPRDDDSHGFGEGPLGDPLFESKFYRMPPVSFGAFGPMFVPDYAALLLFDKYTIDTATLDSMGTNRLYAGFKSLLSALDEAGHLEIVNFRDVIRPHEETIRTSVAYDLKMLSEWLPAFDQLFRSWSGFIRLARTYERQGRRMYGRVDSDESSRSDLRTLFSEYAGMMLPGVLPLTRKALRNAMTMGKGEKRRDTDEFYLRYVRNAARTYLHHVSSTLCLSDVLGAPVHEWNDIEPLYSQKLKISARPSPAGRLEAGAARNLFRLMFPELRFSTPRNFVKVLEDRRIESLRAVVKDAVRAGVEIDNDFAMRTIAQVVTSEQILKRRKDLWGWITLPISAIPWAGSALQRVGDAAIGRIVEARTRRDYGWFFLISEHSDKRFRVGSSW